MKCITKMLLTVVGGIGLISSLGWAECSWVLWDAYVLAGWTEQRWERQAAYPSYVACIDAARNHADRLAKLGKTWEGTRSIERRSEPGPEEVVRIILGEVAWDVHGFACWPDTIAPRAK
jgi:hypothetical protein